MDLSKYRIEDFVLDPLFRNWVLNRSNPMNVFWVLWIKNHPERLNDIYEARMIVHILNPDETSKVDQAFDDKWQEICN